MTDDGHEFNPNNDPEYTPLRPRPRKPERAGKPRAADPADIASSLARIIDGILERDGRNLREMRYRGRGR